ncbi:MAG: tRNA uridine(34) 5-carboxymethylaminomethyl modification radical SAM/GNAT enzyme Elp3 [Chloroflexi bacterium]|nr:tRNA uridine(34) 5-carboxymethylaminomethyl modification radical SAM/GNAT enzyme Elp3 [Chloroflexota bacterium]
MKKLARTISGVTPVAVMTLPMPCPGQCIYCPTYPTTPQSYTPESPAVLRARRCGYDARQQVELRLRILSQMGHPTDKIELIVMGGTFLACPEDYQYQFIKDCYDALNGTESANLEEAKQRNELARHRCTGLCLETRPDYCQLEQVERMLEFGVTRVELGVQTLDDEIYRLVRRGHSVADVVRATRLLREHGFKVHYHWMPGLPGSTPEHDLELSRQLFSDSRFRPDGLKLYPTMVVAGTELAEWYRDGRYQPYSGETMTNLVADIKAIVPPYVRISRVLRDIPSKFIVAGLRDSLRSVVKERMKRLGTECQCIRCREYGHRAQDGWAIGEPHMVRMDYEASDGREIFLSFEDEQATLFGLLRMRVHPERSRRVQDETINRLGAETIATKSTDTTRVFSNLSPFIPFPLIRGEGRDFREGRSPSLTPLPLPFLREGGQGDGLLSHLNTNMKVSPPSGMKRALIRELHIYGAEVPLNQQNPAAAQHKGLGKALLTEAERIAREEFQSPLMVVLSGTGAREYYRSEFGYRPQADYMVKSL